MNRSRAAVLATLAALVFAPGVAGCSVGDPRVVGPSGIDGLVIPTPSPEPADFVADVDNPWLPLVPGSTWRYRVTELGADAGALQVTVAEEDREVAGIATTEVRSVRTDDRGRVVRERRAWFAQDRAGNVWQLAEETAYADGRREAWTAGVDGASAGLAMPATPRVGDGWRQEDAPGAEDQYRVVTLEGSASVPAGGWTDLVLLAESSPLDAGTVVHESYAHGVGLVRAETVSGGTELVELVSHVPG